MSNTKNAGQVGRLHPNKVIAALYNEIPVEHAGWLIRINSEKDTVEVFPPPGDTKHGAFEADLVHLDRAVSDFCKLAAMPIPGVNMYPKDQVSVGSPKSVLGPDSSVGEGWKNPKVNERPTGLDQPGTKGPNKNLGTDSSSENVPHFNPAITRRPKDPTGRGGLPDTSLGPDSSSAPTNWRDRIVKIQEDGRTGRREALHQVQKPRRGPGQLGYGKAQMGEEAAPMVDGSGPADGINARRRAESDPFNVTPVEEPGKHPNKGETPSDPGEVIHTEQGEGKDERDESEGKKGRLVDSFQHPRVDASSVYRQMTARRPSEDLLRDIMDPKKWAAANLMDPKRAQELELLPEEDDTWFQPDADELYMYIINDGDLYRGRTQAILNNLGRKAKNGTFDDARSVDLWFYLAEDGAKKYATEMADSVRPLPWHQLFPTGLRQQVAQMLADYYNPQILQNWPRSAQQSPPPAAVDAGCKADAEGGSDVSAVAPPGFEDTVKDMKKHPEIDNPWALAWHQKNQGAKPGGSDEKKSRRQAGPRLRENWGGSGEYGRDLEAESAEELHALTLALGGQEVDWSRFRPTMPEMGEEESGGEETSTQPEGPKAQAPAPAPAPAPMTANKEAAFRSDDFMQPQVVKDTWVIVYGDMQNDFIPADLVDMTEAQEMQKILMDDPNEVIDLKGTDLGQYTENTQAHEIEIKEGYGARLSAPGYMDATEWAVFDTEEEAWAYLEEMYGDDDFDDEGGGEQEKEASPTDDFRHMEDNPPVYTNQHNAPGDPIKARRQAGGFYDENEEFDENDPQYLAETYINGNLSDVASALRHNSALAFSVMDALPGEYQDDFRAFMQRAASKQAVDKETKDYWSGYMGEYGKDLTEEKKIKPAPSGKDYGTAPKKDVPSAPDKAKEARRQAMLRAKKEAQAAAPIAQPAAPAPSPGNPPAVAPGGPTAPAPGAPAPAQTPPMPKNVPGSTPTPAGAGDQGLQALGWTTEDISLMDEADKKKILQVQLSKPGSNAKPKAPGAGQKPAPSPTPPTPGQTPAIPPSPLTPTPGPVPAGATPNPAAPKPTASVQDQKFATFLMKKLERRKNLRAQAVNPSQNANPVNTPPVGTQPPQTMASPGGATTMPPGKSAPGAAAGGKPSSDPGSEGGVEQKAFDILMQVQQAPVSASSPEQVLSAKVSELARRLLTEVGMTTDDAKQLFGIPRDGSLDKLFRE